MRSPSGTECFSKRSSTVGTEIGSEQGQETCAEGLSVGAKCASGTRGEDGGEGEDCGKGEDSSEGEDCGEGEDSGNGVAIPAFKKGRLESHVKMYKMKVMVTLVCARVVSWWRLEPGVTDQIRSLSRLLCRCLSRGKCTVHSIGALKIPLYGAVMGLLWLEQVVFPDRSSMIVMECA